ncbi:MAG: pantoate--beta-alanine ligase [Proteobacteria bacterium]|jgi:pantoate--beta-alanine ligase|nr:pantoate--beta-alanine ligase [Pseudomonadota bacterium]
MRAPPIIVTDPEEARARCDEARRRGERVAFVPTMGALHEGHLRLLDAAREAGGFVVASVFVNPTQFAAGEDFGRYPRDLEGDVAKISGRGAELVFSPPVEAMYPEGACTQVVVSGLTGGLCGAHRPGHFAGVATVVTKLLNIVGPCAAIFGRKDYQQLLVVRRLAADLDLPVEIVGVPTVRDEDGLALSSRNVYLSAGERRRALAIPRSLAAAHALFAKGERRPEAIRRAVAGPIESAADSVDYVAVADPDTLSEAAPAGFGGRALVAVAARFGGTRLIDNTVLGEDNSPLPLAACDFGRGS